MQLDDIYLLSPQLSVGILGVLVILMDLVVRRKGFVALIALMGLIGPIVFTVLLWINLGTVGGQLKSSLDTITVDQFTLFFSMLILGILFLVLLSSIDYVSRLGLFHGEYFGLLLISGAGMMLLAGASELISIYLALELTTLPLTALAAFLRNERSTEAGLKLLLLSAISSAVLLYGMVLIYGFTGSTDLVVIGDVMRTLVTLGVHSGNYAVLLGVILMIAGFGFKISAVPFQMWVPDVYEGAPTPITAYLSVASKAAGFAILLRVFYLALNDLPIDWVLLFTVLAVLSMTVGNLVAITQNNIKRMLAYSTVAHAGYILVGLVATASVVPEAVSLGATAILFYLTAYAITNLAAFLPVIGISSRIHSDHISDYEGIATRAPLLSAVLAVALVSLTGIPPMAGFMAKIFIFGAAIQAGMVWLAVLGVMNSVVSAYYYLRILRLMYLSPSTSKERITSPVALNLALTVLVLGVMFVGLKPGPVIELAAQASDILFTP